MRRNEGCGMRTDDEAIRIAVCFNQHICLTADSESTYELSLDFVGQFDRLDSSDCLL
jgi:hypothetical protein